MELAGKSILITGIGGFIGLRAAVRSLHQGMNVRGIQRTTEKAWAAQQLGADVVIGDITDAATLQRACEGADIVLHTAAMAQENGPLEVFRAVNVDGAVMVARAAKSAGVQSFVHLSSVMVYGFSYPDHVTEAGPLKGENNPYCQTKIEGEQALQQFSTAHELGLIIIRPGDVYGPGSVPWVLRPLKLMRQRLFVLANDGRGVMNHVYIDNLIDAIFLAITQEAYGETFNVTDGEETTWRDYFNQLAQVGDVSIPYSLPVNILKPLVALRSFGQRLIGQSPDLQPEAIAFITRPYAYSIEKARTQLGYSPTVSLAEGMQQVHLWLTDSNSNRWQVPHLSTTPNVNIRL